MNTQPVPPSRAKVGVVIPLPGKSPTPAVPSIAAGPRTGAGSSIDPEVVSDVTLVQRANAGDGSAFTQIVARHRPKIFTITLALLRNHADAEEITQDTFLSAYRNLAGFRGDCSLSTWLHRIAVNRARNLYGYYCRRQRQNTRSLDSALSEESAATFADLIAARSFDPAQETAMQEFGDLIDSCMEQLDEEHQEILKLRGVQHHSYGEIATILGINVGTVKSRIARARECLRGVLADQCPEFTPDSNPSEWLIAAPGMPNRALVACA